MASSSLVHEAACLSQPSIYAEIGVGSNASEGRDLPVRVRASFFLALGCHQEMWPRANLPTLKDLDQR